jgi:hypothetical protein
MNELDPVIVDMIEPHVQQFLKKSGYSDARVDKELLFPYPEGFFTAYCQDDALFLVTGSGDGKFIDEKTIALAKELGYTKIRLQTKRNPKAWERRHGYKLAGYILEKEI